MKARYDVCATVVSDLPYDARVWKEVRSLANAGYSVALIGCRYGIERPQRSSVDGVDVLELPLGGRAGRVSYGRRARVLLRLWFETLRTPARVYHAHNIHPGPAAWLAAKTRRAFLVYDAHELYGESGQSGAPGRLAAALSRWLERRLVLAADDVITTNPSRAEVLRKRHGRSGIVVLANVPGTVQVLEPLDPGYPSDTPVLLYQGGIYAQRAFRETLLALRLVPSVHLVVLGFGREEEIERIRGWAVEAGVADRLRFLPPRPYGELVQTAAAATVGLVPIRPERLNHYLGDTNKLHEYLMAGLPVIATDIPEIRRVVTAGEPPVGELFDATSPDSIAAALQRVLEDPSLYDRRRVEARRLALSRFNWEIEEAALLAAYARLPLGSSAAMAGVGP